MESINEQNSIHNLHSQTQLAHPKTKVYKYRWVILGIFLATYVLNSFQWIQYSIISNVVQKYYGVPSVYVDWLSIIFMLGYFPFIYPAVWAMDKKGLKVILIMGAVLNCIAAWIKAVSVRPDLFYVTLLGQACAGIAQVFVMSSPSRLAAVWFGQDQVSTACSICLSGKKLGIALGFLLPPIIVKPHANIEDIGTDLSKMFYIIAGLCSVELVVVIFFFRAAPTLPPSPGEASRVTETPSIVDSLKRLARNRGFVLLIIANGLIFAVINSVSTVLNQMFLKYFPSHEEDAGRIGLTMSIAGICGTVVSGFFLDKTLKFKGTALALSSASMIGMLAFIFTLPTSIEVVYCNSAIIGFCMMASMTVGLEFGAEITYPESEGTMAGVFYTSANLFSVLVTLGASAFLNALGDVWTNAALTVMLLISTIMTALIKQDLRRQKAHAKGEESGKDNPLQMQFTVQAENQNTIAYRNVASSTPD